MRTRLPVIVGLLVLTGAVVAIAQRPVAQVGPQPDGSVLVTTNQVVKPVGLVRTTEGVRPKDMALSPDGKTVAVLTTTKVFLYTSAGEQLADLALRPGPLGLAWAPDGTALYTSGTGGQIYRVEQIQGKWSAKPTAVGLPGPMGTGKSRQPADPQVAGLVVSPDGKRLYAVAGIRNAVAVIALPELKVESMIPVGVAPYSLALSPDGTVLVSGNRGGRLQADDADAPTDYSAGSRVRIDPETDAALRGTLSFIDTETGRAREIDAGRQPAGMAFSADGATLYLANSDEDTLSEIDVAARTIKRSISVGRPQDPGFGQIPTDVSLGPDGQLYVSLGGANQVLVVQPKEMKPVGYIAAGWYPVAVVAGEGQLFVASSKGLGARTTATPGKMRVHGSTGTVQFISREQQMAALTASGAGDKPLEELQPRRGIKAVPIPERVGEPSLFKHVVYILKENHTYDMDLGDIPEGNGDPSLCIFGEQVTPNEHALAREFVLLDNTYTSGTNSADGHQWTGSAVANGYIEQNYSANARSYPYDGGDPLAYSPRGFLWNAAVKQGKSVRVYGEFVNRPKITPPAGARATWKLLWEDYRTGANQYQITAETDNAALQPLLHPRFIGFPMTVSDQWRADQYLADLRSWEASGKMPDLSIMLLPNNHAAGTSPGMPTPRAMTADNDLALGRIIEGLSRSRFWKETLVLVIEDDSQLGTDHVDGHRTVAFCASPYTKRGVKVSEPYNHLSVLRTMELVLGIPPMTRFDRNALPMTACFMDKANLTPYKHHPNRIALDEMNPAVQTLRGEARRLAEACSKLDWTDVDRAHAETVARAVWESARPGKPFPKHAYHAVSDDDDEE